MGFKIADDVLEKYAPEPTFAKTIVEARFYVGHQIFVPKDKGNIYGKDAFFPAADASGDAIEASKQAAHAKLVELGLPESRFPFAVAIVEPKEKVITRDTSKRKLDELWHIVTAWDRYAEEYAEGETGGPLMCLDAVLESFEHLEPSDYGQPTWMELDSILRIDNNGNKKYFPIVLRRFANREEAVAAAREADSYVVNEAVWAVEQPEWFDEDMAGAPWGEFNKAFADNLNDNSPDTVVAMYADMLGVPEESLLATVMAISEQVRNLPPF